MLYRTIYNAHSETTHGLPKQPSTPTVKTLITRTTIHTTLLLAMLDTTTLLRTVKTMTRTGTLRETTPTTIRTTMLLWIVDTKTHTTTILPTVPPVLLRTPTAMADTPTASPVTQGFVITTTTITIQRPAAVATRKITNAIPLATGLETLALAPVVDIPETEAAN